MRGLPLSWEQAVATIHLGPWVSMIVWSPCSKFIAAGTGESVEILNADTLNQIATFKCPPFSGDSHLSFSLDSRSLTLLADRELISWDLQTGGCQSEIPLGFRGGSFPRVKSSTYSRDGKMVAVACKHIGFEVYTFDLLSKTCLGPLPVPGGQLVPPIWTHDKYLRFATMHPGSITIWEVEFTLKHPPKKVESFPIPDEVVDGRNFLFLPVLYRLAFTLRDTIQVRDVKASRLLLKPKAVHSPYPPSPHSFSSDGRLFAFATYIGEVWIWMDSPTGYLPHQRLPLLLDNPQCPHLSPNGGSIILSLDGTINLWHTDDGQQNSTLTFSPNEKSAAFAQLRGKVVTILDLQSGALRLTIDAGMEVRSLAVAGDTVVVVGEGKIATWNIPGGDRIFDASINDSVRTVTLDRSPPFCHPARRHLVSLSPDLSHVAVTGSSEGNLHLEIRDAPTGRCLASTKLDSFCLPQFTRDGREVWILSESFRKKGWEIIEDNKSGTMELKPQEETSYPPGRLPWQSPRGFKVTDDGWVLSPTQKRLFWLPRRWRSSEEEHMLWSGRFLGLSHRLPEVVILEFFE